MRKILATSWLRRILRVCGALSIGLSIVLLVLEIGVRLFLPQPQDSEWLQPDARYGHTAKKDFHQHYQYPAHGYVMHVQTNSSGFRDEEIAPRKEGQKTVLFVGDSFTFGYGVQMEERFDERLASLCEKDAADCRFINAGVDGWGTIAATRFVTDNLASFQPDIIILTFCENDPFDDAYLLAEGVTYGSKAIPGKELLRHSQLFRLFRRGIWLMKHRPETGQGQALAGDLAATKGQAAADAITIPPEYWDRTLACLHEFHQNFLKFNPRGVLIIQAAAPTCTDIREHLSAFANGTNIIFCDMHDAVAPLSVDERRLPHDPHWSLKLHEISAEHLHKIIARVIAQPAAHVGGQ